MPKHCIQNGPDLEAFAADVDRTYISYLENDQKSPTGGDTGETLPKAEVAGLEAN
ncbi:hypothetical protein PLANPX_0703 [Lacipirellula parvula]|uniref:Uncharacterized protein n=1 Tax=Lacipirellula parvula TaxID=2650471 RepID=A0A5K7X8K6_9BACT|nr:hypothetical protein PLANPX_0703 [Lacipirellula parvula]